jgi:hypothetical protein
MVGTNVSNVLTATIIRAMSTPHEKEWDTEAGRTRQKLGRTDGLGGDRGEERREPMGKKGGGIEPC